MQKIDYKDVLNLKKFISKRGKILPRTKTRLSAKNQRRLAREIKKARLMALLPFISRE